MSPVEAAARLRHLPGLVFFDSARGDGVSVIAANPVRVIEGTDWEALASEVASLGAGEIVAGRVDYEGRFVFGRYEQALVYADGAWSEAAASLPELSPPHTEGRRQRHPEFEARVSQEAFCEMVRGAQEEIRKGSVYQVNLSHRFVAEWEGDSWAFYLALRECSPAPYAAYLALGDARVLSSSPECFLQMSGRSIFTRPIKGTRPRAADPAADEIAARELISSAKERAELVMITDLERNDLGQVCDYGSVRVAELCALEGHEQVWHLVSTVEGRLRPEVDHVAALRACFPGGSITGAPKGQARRIIAELEPEGRGVYTGAIGFFGKDESRFSIAIRTVVIEGGLAHFHVGAGIVADSVPEAEWRETLDKAAGILLAARGGKLMVES